MATWLELGQVLLELVVMLMMVLLLWLKAVLMFFLPTSLVGKDVRGQTVLITGAGGGVGRLLAQNMASLGCRLVLWDVNEDMNQQTASLVKSTGAVAYSYTVDLANKDVIYETAEKVEKEVGQIDILVNNAGVVFGKTAMESSEEQMEATVRVNMLAHFWMAKAFLPAMLRRHSGHLVTMASSAGLMGVPGMADYCSSKFGAVGFEESLHLELRQSGVKTTVVCPYLINTSMFSGCSARFPWVMDALTPEYVAHKICDAIQREQEMLMLPKLIYAFVLFKAILPVPCKDLALGFFGATSMMNSFVGTKKKI